MSAPHPPFQKICEDHGARKARPDEPDKGADVWYRGWECGWHREAAYWGMEPWVAYKGGADLDAPHASGRSWSHLLDEIDDLEDDAADAGQVSA